jgi:hypothetical protein
MFQTKLKINGNQIQFVNYFESKKQNMTDEEKEKEESRIDSLECELDKEYTKYYLNNTLGVQNRMDYAAKNGIFFSCGFETTYIYKINDDIYGFDVLINDLFNSYEKTKDINLTLKNIEEEIGFNVDDKENTKKWYLEWKKSRYEGFDFFKNLIIENKSYQYCGMIDCEMSRIMGAEPETINLHQLQNDRFNNFVNVELKPGEYTLESDLKEEAYIRFSFKLNS